MFCWKPAGVCFRGEAPATRLLMQALMCGVRVAAGRTRRSPGLHRLHQPKTTELQWTAAPHQDPARLTVSPLTTHGHGLLRMKR